MSTLDVLLWAILPYAAMTTFVVGHWWRYRTDQVGWTSGSTQLFERRILRWAGPAFHLGILAAAAGHVIGLVVPSWFVESLGISEPVYHWFSGIAGGLAGVVAAVGLLGLLWRRTANPRVRRTTNRTDVVVFALLAVLTLMGLWMALVDNLFAGEPADYRSTIGVWWRSLFLLRPDVQAAADAQLLFQIHAVLAWAFWAVFPFSRLVHVWSVPFQFLGRPRILYRRRQPVTAATTIRRTEP